MRQVKEFDTVDGSRFRVRYRQGGTQTSQTFRTRKDAQTFATILDGGGVTDALAWLAARGSKQSEVTFGQWFEKWVTELTGITPGTRAGYHSLHRRYLTHLDDMPLPLITRSHVAAIVNKMAADGLALKTTKNAIHMLSSSLALAVEDGLIARNPCLRVKLPKQEDAPEDDIRYLTHQEFAALVEALPNHYRPLVVFMVGTGMRWSEVTALQARHIDLAAGTVRVQQAWKRVPGTGFVIGPPKSKKSRRTVNAATMALAAAEPLMKKPDDYVFTTTTGKVVRHSNFYNRIWLPAIEQAGLTGAKPHDLRHTHASWLISDGISLEAIQDQLGHESILTTRKIYGHLLPALGVAVGQSASRALERALQGSHAVPVILGDLEPVHAVQAPDEGVGA